MSEVTVNLGARSYPIFIQAGLFSTPKILNPYIDTTRVIVVTNETIFPLYSEKLLSLLCEYEVDTIVIPDGEAFKTLTQLEDIIGQLLHIGCGRDTTLVALGGGVIGDLCGFVAASFQRGVPFIQVPTTLLSQVDSSVGGKTAVNHKLGKNMIGAFYQPQAVLIDTQTLSTLPAKEFAAGMAEVIKYGIIYDAEFFKWLESNYAKLKSLDNEALAYAITRCCEIKAEIVANDETERGQRALLNLGHTFGHAIEAEMGYGNWLHGEAVAAGMVIASQVAERKGWMSASEVRRIVELLNVFSLPIAGPKHMQHADYQKHMAHDKKVLAGKIRFVIPKGIGKAVVTNDIGIDLLEDILG